MHGELSLKQQTATPYVKKSNEEKAICKLHKVNLKLKKVSEKIQKKIENTPKCKNLRSGWLQTLLYQESTTWSKTRGVNLMRPQNVACNTCRGTR